MCCRQLMSKIHTLWFDYQEIENRRPRLEEGEKKFRDVSYLYRIGL